MYFNKGEHKSYLHLLYLLPKGSGSGQHTDAGLYLAGFVGTVSGGVKQVDFVRRGWWRWAFDVVGGWVFDIVGGLAFDMVGGQAFDVVGGWAFGFGMVGGWGVRRGWWMGVRRGWWTDVRHSWCMDI